MKKRIHLNAFNIIPFILPLLLAGPGLQAAILLFENFETDGLGTRYTGTGVFSDGIDDYFTRTDGFTEASGIPAFTGFGGTYFWAAEDTDASENASGVTLLDFSGLDLSTTPVFQISLDIGAGSNSAFDSVDDFLLVQYRFDAGPWQTALSFQNNGQTFNGPLLVDTDFDGIGDGTELGLAFQTITSSSISTTGTLMDLRIDTLMTSGSEAVAFDNIQVSSIPEPSVTALIAGMGGLLLMLARRFLPKRENESRA